jgi:hypothetical protein
MQEIARSNQAACHSFFTVRDLGLHAAFDGASIDADFLNPVRVKRNARVGLEIAAGQRGNRSGGMRVLNRPLARYPR